jgi:hypothetical protein
MELAAPSAGPGGGAGDGDGAPAEVLVLAADRVVLRAGGVTVAEASLASLMAQPAINDRLPAWTRPLGRPDAGVVAELAIEKLEVSRSGGGRRRRSSSPPS